MNAINLYMASRYLIGRCDHPDMHFTSTSLFFLKEIINSSFDINAEF